MAAVLWDKAAEKEQGIISRTECQSHSDLAVLVLLAFVSFGLFHTFVFYLSSLYSCRLTLTWGAFVFIHFRSPVCIFSSVSHLFSDSEFINRNRSWFTRTLWDIICRHVTPWPCAPMFLHQFHFIYWMWAGVKKPTCYVTYTSRLSIYSKWNGFDLNFYVYWNVLYSALAYSLLIYLCLIKYCIAFLLTCRRLKAWRDGWQ